MGSLPMISQMKTFLFLSCLSSLFLSSSATRNDCKDGWFDASFLELGCLLFNSTASYSWEEANVYCQRTEQARLVEISSSAQLDFVQMELGLLGGDYWWTSGTDLGREDSYAWMGSLNLVEEFIWYQNEPSGGYDHNCLCLTRGLGYFGADCDCDYKTQVICQQMN